MKQTKSLSRLFLVGVVCLLSTLLGTTLMPTAVSADGSGAGSPPVESPTTDSLPDDDGGSTSAESDADLTSSTTDTYTVSGGTMYELWTLMNL